MTGCIIAVKGIPQDGGKFSVTDYCWPTPSPTSKKLTKCSSADDRYNFLILKLNIFYLGTICNIFLGRLM